MSRSTSLVLAAAACAALVFAAAPAQACPGKGEAHACACDHGKMKDGKAHAKKHGEKKGPEGAKKGATKVEEAKEEAPAPAKDASLLAPVDRILSATCTCKGPADCTCKKGECKCKECKKHHGIQETRFLDSLNGTPVTPALPGNARRDATAGVFI